MTGAIDIAHARIRSVRPLWTSVTWVRDIWTGEDRILFHAGPPFAAPQDVPPPVMNSLIAAALYEGWASDAGSARAAILAGRIGLQAAQDHDLLVPLAGVLSPSMAVVTVADENNPARRKYCALNEGNSTALRLGKADPTLTAHHRWLNGLFADWLAPRLHEPIDLFYLMRSALAAGDECHARTGAGSAALAHLLIDRAGPEDKSAELFLTHATAFALSLWMAGAALCLSAAEGTARSAVVTRAGGNGHRFGWQLASQPGIWHQSPAPRPRGTVEPVAAGCHPIGALGDSAVVDFFGLGGQSLARAPVLTDALAMHLPSDWAMRATICLGPPHAEAGLSSCGTDARAAAAAGKGPIVLIGMVDAAGEAGRIGGGVVDVPGSLFRANVA
jgi:hypothetical protein